MSTNRQPSLLDVGARPDFDGETYDRARDGDRLHGQLWRVKRVLSDGHWWTLEEIAQTVDGSVPGVSARLRDLRKAKFGGHTVERRYMGNGQWEYRLLMGDTHD